jgi:ribosomal-protein-alanine N-acetyltransferase
MSPATGRQVVAAGTPPMHHDLPILTPRLALRQLDPDSDADFILELVNTPGWLRHIGDRGIRSLDDARSYLREGPCEMYARHGLSLLLVERNDTGQKLGICGLIRRDGLDDIDLGFAFLPEHWSQGYAFESAVAVLRWGSRHLRLERIVAITAPDNVASIRLLEKLGFRFERLFRLQDQAPEVRLYVWTGLP